MAVQILEPNRPGWRFWLFWMLATFVGAIAGMLLSFPFQIILEAALGPSRLPPWTTTEHTLIVVLKGAQGGMMGLGMGVGQWLVFRKYLMNTRGWILATGLAAFLQGAFRWMLPYDMPAQQVGVSITISFGIFLGVCQWVVLRGHIPHAEWWIAISMAGWMPVLALMFAPDFGQVIGMTLMGIAMIVPFALAGAGMIWLLRQTELITKPDRS